MPRKRCHRLPYYTRKRFIIKVHLTVEHHVGGSCMQLLCKFADNFSFVQEIRPIEKTKAKMVNIFLIVVISTIKNHNQTNK